MILGYILNGQTLGKDIFTWVDNELSGNQPFIINESLTPNYGDISSINNWASMGESLGKDFYYVRNQIAILTSSIGFNNLSHDEKIISAKYFVVGKPERDSVLTEEEQINYWGDLVNKSQQSRFDRWDAAKKYISYNLSPINSSDLAKSTSELCNDYINYNIITKTKDGISGLFDYLTGVEDYSTNGYPSKTYWTLQDQNRIMDILQNGNY